MYVDVSRTYIGLVEANSDPQKLGRCKIRVADVFDELPTVDIPWASPRKDVNGNTFNIPDVGKFVTVKFDNGNIYSPEYYYSDLYNENLENKLKKVSETSYGTMKSLMFDDKTQIYSCDDEGLIVDYKYNMIQVTDSKVNLSLKDNFAKLNLGDSNADEAFILGNSFLDWFSEFLEALVGETVYHGNYGSSLFATPTMIELIEKYRLLKDNSFLSDNVRVASNFKISSVINKSTNRPSAPLRGDDYQSTIPFSDVKQTSTEPVTKPVDIRPKEPSRLDTSTGAQDLPNYGKLVVSSDKNSPTLICFGGIDVNGRSSGDYMWDYFGDLKNKFQIFVAKDHKVDGEESYKSVIKYLESNGYNTSEQILYLFSGGYKPAIPVLNSFEKKFQKFILVDIWIGNDNVSNYYNNLAKNNKNKTYYIYTSFGSNNKQGSQNLAQNSGFNKLKSGGAMSDHMDCNKLAIEFLVPGINQTKTTTQIVNNQVTTTQPVISVEVGPVDPDLNNIDYSFLTFYDGVVPGSQPSLDYRENKLNYSLLADIAVAAKSANVKIGLTTAIRGHRDSARHNLGVAIDIALVNGKGYSSEQDAKNKGIYEDIIRFVEALSKLGYVKNSESGNDKGVLYFGFPNHHHHIHVSRKSGSEKRAPGKILSKQEKKDKGLPI